MPKMSDLCKCHCHTTIIGRRNYILIPHAPTRLNRSDSTRFGRGDEAVGERKESVRGDDGTIEIKASLTRFPDCDLRTIDTRHLPRADT